VRKRDGKGILEGPRRGWENIIKIDLNKVEWEGVERDRRLNAVIGAVKHRVA
jgi:hypothetical protein